MVHTTGPLNIQPRLLSLAAVAVTAMGTVPIPVPVEAFSSVSRSVPVSASTAVQKIEMKRAPNGHVLVYGLHPGQQLLTMPDGSYHVIVMPEIKPEPACD